MAPKRSSATDQRDRDRSRVARLLKPHAPPDWEQRFRKTDLLEPFPKVKAYYARCVARPAWQRTLGLYAERLGVNVDDIR